MAAPRPAGPQPRDGLQRAPPRRWSPGALRRLLPNRRCPGRLV